MGAYARFFGLTAPLVIGFHKVKTSIVRGTCPAIICSKFYERNKWHATVIGRTVCAWPDSRPWPPDQSWEDHCRRKATHF
jgi:hypothetical protein